MAVLELMMEECGELECGEMRDKYAQIAGNW